MYKLTDGFINLLKWPVAVCLLLSAPALINSYMYFDFFRFIIRGNIIFFYLSGERGKKGRRLVREEREGRLR